MNGTRSEACLRDDRVSRVAKKHRAIKAPLLSIDSHSCVRGTSTLSGTLAEFFASPDVRAFTVDSTAELGLFPLFASQPRPHDAKAEGNALVATLVCVTSFCLFVGREQRNFVELPRPREFRDQLLTCFSLSFFPTFRALRKKNRPDVREGIESHR